MARKGIIDRFLDSIFDAKWTGRRGEKLCEQELNLVKYSLIVRSPYYRAVMRDSECAAERDDRGRLFGEGLPGLPNVTMVSEAAVVHATESILVLGFCAAYAHLPDRGPVPIPLPFSIQAKESRHLAGSLRSNGLYVALFSARAWRSAACGGRRLRYRGRCLPPGP